jgi:diphthine-ammonia ligase
LFDEQFSWNSSFQLLIVVQQAYHSFIAGQIGMIPRSLDLPEPSSLAKETAWSLRNLVQIAELHGSDLINRTAFCIAYVNNPEHFAPVIAAWNHIANKVTNMDL